MMFFGISSELLSGFVPNNSQSQRVVENLGMVQQLMRGPSHRDPLCRAAEFTLLHQPSSTLHPRCLALFTRANLPQQFPGINAQIMFIVPRKPDRILADPFGRERPRGG